MEDAIIPLLIAILVIIALYFLVGYAAMGFVGWGVAGLIAFVLPLLVGIYRVIAFRNPASLASVVTARFDGDNVTWGLDEPSVRRDWVWFGTALSACAAFVYAAVVNNQIFRFVQIGSKDDSGLLLFYWWLLTIVAIGVGVWRGSKIMAQLMVDGATQSVAKLTGAVSGDIAALQSLDNEICAICAELQISPQTNFKKRVQNWIDRHITSLVRDIRSLDNEIAQATADAANLRDRLQHAVRLYESVERDHVDTSYEVARRQAYSLMPVLEDCHTRMLASREEFLPMKRWSEFIGNLEEISRDLAEIRSLAPELAPETSRVSRPPTAWDEEEWQEPRTKEEAIAKARKILDITDDANTDDVEMRYDGLKRAFHPDRFRRAGVDHEMYKKSEERFKRVAWAYQTLTGKFDRQENHT